MLIGIKRLIVVGKGARDTHYVNCWLSQRELVEKEEVSETGERV